MSLPELESLVEARISSLGVHLVELVIRGDGKGKSVELYIDAEQGISTEICSEVSRSIDRTIESSGVVRGPYRLTVSSPGISRPLKYPWQYKKHVGRELSLKVRAQDGVRDVTGKVGSVDDVAIVLSTGKNGTQESVAFDTIVEARVKAPW